MIAHKAFKSENARDAEHLSRGLRDRQVDHDRHLHALFNFTMREKSSAHEEEFSKQSGGGKLSIHVYAPRVLI